MAKYKSECVRIYSKFLGHADVGSNGTGSRCILKRESVLRIKFRHLRAYYVTRSSLKVLRESGGYIFGYGATLTDTQRDLYFFIQRVTNLPRPPRLACVLVGSNPSSIVYVKERGAF